MNEYQIAMWIGGAIFAFCILAYIFCWIIQWAWAWVDDKEASNKNWLSSKFEGASKWKYPVHNEYGVGLEAAIKNNHAPFGYAKDKKHNNGKVGGLMEGVDYVYSHDVRCIGGFFMLAVIAFALPITLLCALKVYPLTLAVLIITLIAYLARFARRNKKMFDDHTKDKDAHK